jgi:hypothetical protein
MGFNSRPFAPSFKAIDLSPVIRRGHLSGLLFSHRPSTAPAAAENQPQPLDDPVEAMLWAVRAIAVVFKRHESRICKHARCRSMCAACCQQGLKLTSHRCSSVTVSTDNGGMPAYSR